VDNPTPHTIVGLGLSCGTISFKLQLQIMQIITSSFKTKMEMLQTAYGQSENSLSLEVIT
jgi:hypothetical protein